MIDFVVYLASQRSDVGSQLLQHLLLVAVAMVLAVGLGVPLGLVVARRVRARRAALAFANAMQTVPSLALFGFLIPMPLVGGTGARPAIVALMLYALLPIVKNTVTGLANVPAPVREAARAMGMTNRQLLWRVEIPLSLSVMLAGIRIAAVISVGTATIAAAIGAEGLGVFIFRGLDMSDHFLILAGAIPAALLALVLDALLGVAERALVVRGSAPSRRGGGDSSFAAGDLEPIA